MSGSDIREPQAAQIRQVQLALSRDVAERVAARVAILRGIGHLADADAIENDPDHAIEHSMSRPVRIRVRIRALDRLLTRAARQVAGFARRFVPSRDRQGVHRMFSHRLVWQT